MRSLILGYVEHYTADDLRPFVESLRRTSFEGHVTFFVRNLSRDTRAYLKRQGIECIRTRGIDTKKSYRFPSWLADGLGLPDTAFRPDLSINFRIAKALRGLNLTQTQLGQRLAKVFWHCNAARFLYYREYLRAHPEYDCVLITDVRDVIFQTSPFSNETAHQLHLFEEHPRTPLGEQKDNAHWIEAMYGASALQSIATHPILCMGVLLGGYQTILEALDDVIDEMLSRYVGWGTDQGVLNFLARTDALSDTRIHPYGSGSVLHLGIAPFSDVRVDVHGHVLNDDGQVCPVLHQYDRHPDLTDRLLRHVQPVAMG